MKQVSVIEPILQEMRHPMNGSDASSRWADIIENRDKDNRKIIEHLIDRLETRLSEADEMMGEIEKLKDKNLDYENQIDDIRKENIFLQEKVCELNTALVDCRADDRTCMEYLQQVRDIVGGEHFLDMIQRIRIQDTRLHGREMLIDSMDRNLKQKDIEINKLRKAIAVAHDAMKDGADAFAWAVLLSAINTKEDKP
jgi:DNA repair exonuclease SbcCD ATPase subunit